ncbi:hypothetical protein [Alkalicoccus urumqiensis]|uniref:Pilus assembly protein PilO n=1 Tax=Alkalicoccus urumqiensis TaxID=1548213 RepID=A0A2P6MF69_ALKUR|nr:hypothetical protein [Alkalicoccus urumqiensis]PRO64897.1 hypothetical protein C6I21_12180 [Alkalicoccus urumqiensis]
MTFAAKQKLLTFGVLLLVVLSLTAVYFNTVHPEWTGAADAEEAAETEDAYIQELEGQLREAEEEASGMASTTDLQRRLPVVRQTDQFLMDISMAEELADIRIMDIYMDYDQPVYAYETVEVGPSTGAEDQGESIDDVRREEIEEDEELTATDDDVELEDVDLESDLEDREVETDETLPDGAVQEEPLNGVRKQTAVIELKVNTYEHLERFLAELDALERYTNIESILFLGQDEDRIFDGQSDIFFEVQVSSFYYPAREDLEPEAPVRDYPETPDRESPFRE